MERWEMEYSEGPVVVRESQIRYCGEVFQIIERWQATPDKGSIIYEERLSGPAHDSARIVTFYTSSSGSSSDLKPKELDRDNQIKGSSSADSSVSGEPGGPGTPLVGTGDTTVLCADDPRVQADVKFILGPYYEELATILPLATYVEPSKPVHALGGVLHRTADKSADDMDWLNPEPSPAGTILVCASQLQTCPEREVFLFESHDSFFETNSFTGPFLVFSRVIILPDQMKDELGAQIRQSYPGLAATGRSPCADLLDFYRGTIPKGSGPWVDFLEFDDGTAWGAGRVKEGATLLARLDGLDNAQALEILCGILTTRGASSSELIFAGNLAGFCRRKNEQKAEPPLSADAGLTVLRADDPAAMDGVRSVLGCDYEELKEALPMATFVHSSKPVTTAAGTIFSIQEFSQTFVLEPGPFPAGPMVIFPHRVVVPGQAGGESLAGMKGFYKANMSGSRGLQVPRSLSGPWVDFLEFDDGTSWGIDTLGCRNRAKERAAILEQLEGLDDTQAQEVLKSVMAKPKMSWPERQLVLYLTSAVDRGELATAIARMKKGR